MLIKVHSKYRTLVIGQATQYRSFRRQAKSLIDRLSCNFVKQRRFSLLTNETTGLDWLNLVLLLFWWLFFLFIESKAVFVQCEQGGDYYAKYYIWTFFKENSKGLERGGKGTLYTENVSKFMLKLFLLLFSYLVAKSCLTVSQPHGLEPAVFLCLWDFPGESTGVEYVTVSFSRGSSQPRDQTCFSCIASRFFPLSHH